MCSQSRIEAQKFVFASEFLNGFCYSIPPNEYGREERNKLNNSGITEYFTYFTVMTLNFAEGSDDVFSNMV